MGTVGSRVATVDDLPALRSIFRGAVLSNEGDRPLIALHPEWLELDDAAVRAGRTVAATDDDVVVGFASSSPGVDGAVELDDLFVDPGCRRAGHARRLIDHLSEGARAAGATAMEVTANEHARAFYEAAGFVQIGTADTEGGPAPRMRRAV